MGKAKKAKKIKQKEQKAARAAAPQGFETFFERLAFYTILSQAFLIPLLLSRTSYDQFDLPKMVYFRMSTCWLVFLYLGHILLKRNNRVYFHPAFWAALAFLVSVTVSTVFSVHIPTAVFGKYRRYEGFLMFLNYVLLLFFILQIVTDRKRITALITSSVISGALVSLYGLMQYFGYDFYQWTEVPFEIERSFSTLGNPALLAGFLVIVFPLSVGMLLEAKKPWPIFFYSLTTFLIVADIYTAFNRTGWIASIIAFAYLALIVAFLIWKKRASWEALLSLAIVVVLILAIGAFFQYQSKQAAKPATLVERAETIVGEEAGGSFESRLEIWKAAVGMIKKSPLFGLGPDTFRISSRTYQTFRYAHISPTIVADNAHNYVFQIASGNGLVGLGIFLFFVFWIFWESLKMIFKEESRLEEAWMLKAGLATSFFAYGVFLLASVSIVGATYFWWVAFGIILVTSKGFKERSFSFSPDSDQVRQLALTLIGVICLFGTWSFYNTYRADKTFVAASQSVVQGDLKATVGLFETAISFNPYNDRYPAELGRILFDAARQFIAQSKDKTFFNEAEKAFMAAKRTSPLETDNYIFLADLYRFAGENFDQSYFKQALEEANKAQKIAPYLYTAPYLRALVWQSQGDTSQAISQMQECIRLYPNFSMGHSFLGDLYLTSGKLEKSIEEFELALKHDPNNTLAKERLDGLKAVGK